MTVIIGDICFGEREPTGPFFKFPASLTKVTLNRWLYGAKNVLGKEGVFWTIKNQIDDYIPVEITGRNSKDYLEILNYWKDNHVVYNCSYNYYPIERIAADVAYKNSELNIFYNVVSIDNDRCFLVIVDNDLKKYNQELFSDLVEEKIDTIEKINSGMTIIPTQELTKHVFSFLAHVPDFEVYFKETPNYDTEVFIVGEPSHEFRTLFINMRDKFLFPTVNFQQAICLENMILIKMERENCSFIASGNMTLLILKSCETDEEWFKEFSNLVKTVETVEIEANDFSDKQLQEICKRVSVKYQGKDVYYKAKDGYVLLKGFGKSLKKFGNILSKELKM